MTRSLARLEELLDLVLTSGHLSIRVATMEPGKRYKIDVRDPNLPTVLLNADRPLRELVAAFPEIERRLASWHAAQKRVPLASVDELELETDDVGAATGTDDRAELVARAARRNFGVVHGAG